MAPAPPPDPKDYISDVRKDRAPVTVDAFFPGRKLTMGDRVYAKGATHRTTKCATTTQGPLGPILTNNGCDQVVRATYSRSGVAVTIGLAVFETEAQAKKAAQQASGGLASLSGRGCRRSAAAARSAVARPTPTAGTPTSDGGGFTSGRDVTKADKNVFAVGDDLTNFTFRQIRHRGEVQASAAATAAPTA